jgi:UDP-N-acetylmuramoyl-tripeptide--D-alanyl-D-alanine ligase
MKFSPQQLADATGGALIKGGAVGSVCTDTRVIQEGDWFLALRGERFDAHDFIDQAHAAGASGVIAERVHSDWAAGHIAVEDGLTALQSLGRYVRDGFSGPVVGITGSAGKTTSRALVGLALEGLGQVHQTKGNFNNHIGLPLTLLEMDEAADALVLEMGMNHAGEIALLANIGRPTVRIITNVGAAHLEGLGSIEAVAAAKGELFDAAQPGDTCCVNVDDPFVAGLPIPEGVHVLRYGADPTATLRLIDATVDPDTLNTHFQVSHQGEIVNGILPSPGIHMAHNAVGALAVGLALKQPLAKMVEAFSRYSPVGMRLRLEPGPGGTQIINDAYNANPMSVAANLRTLASIPRTIERRRIALLGDMLELGETEIAQHSEIAELARALDLDLVGFVGPRFEQAVDESSLWAEDAEGLGIKLRGALKPGDIVLIKGSRGMRMERVLNGLDATERP